MSALPPQLCEFLEAALGTSVTAASSLSGGMINRAARVETADGPVFVKWKAEAPPGFFEGEAHGLALLAASGALRIPVVLATGGGAQGVPPFLALEYIETARPNDPERFARRFGTGLARLHRENLAPDGRFGLDRDNTLGRLPQINTPTELWSEFYRECRLLPQINRAREACLLHPVRERVLMHVVERLETLLDGLESVPSLLHGDLWGGNYLTAYDDAALIDPAVYYGEREMEIAYMELFGGFAPDVYAAYRESYPLDPGYERRRLLHQLYHLLNHLNHFGEQYGADVDAACQELLR